MPFPDTRLLAELIRGKRECLLQLRDLGRRQIELIDEGNITALLEVLTAKQRPLERLQQIERALDPFRGQDPDRRRWPTSEDRRLCTEQLQQCERLLAEIISQERCSEGALLQRRDEAASRLQEAHFAGQAREAYTGQPDRQAKQIDLYCIN
jgi:hypothetical protein